MDVPDELMAFKRIARAEKTSEMGQIGGDGDRNGAKDCDVMHGR